MPVIDSYPNATPGATAEFVYQENGATKNATPQQIQDALPGFDAKVDFVATLAALQLIDGTSGQIVYLAGRTSAGDGGEGHFLWVTGDQSANVTADTQSGVWVAGTDGTGAGGAWKRQYEHLFSTYFGTIADWNGSTGTNNTTAMMAFFAFAAANSVSRLSIPPGSYYFGSYALSSNVVAISGLSDALISAHGAEFVVETTATVTPFLFVFTNPNKVVWEGGKFFDVGFNPASWLTHSRWGMGAFRLDADTLSRGFTLRDCSAENLTYLLISDLRANKRLMEDITVENCRVKTAYYGVDVLYVGNNLKINNLICEDVRRGFISFGLRNADADIKLYTSSGFLGSNGFVSIASEGEAYDDGNGVLGTEGNVENVRVNLNVSGFEGHENYIHFYHQQADSAGSISNISADVKVNNLSSAGKHVSLGDTNIFLFDHELPSTAILGSTTREFNNISLSGELVGTITGEIVKADSSNATTPATVSLSPTLSHLAHTLTVTGFNGGTEILSPYERVLALTPVGATTPGTPGGHTTKGTYVKIGKRVFFSCETTWTSHTGTGALRLNGLPEAADTTNAGLQPVEVVSSGLAHTSGSSLRGLVGGVGGTQIIIYDELAGSLSTVAMDTAATVYVSGSYLGV